MGVRRQTLPWTVVWGIDTGGAFQPVTGWMPTAGLEKARAVIELIGKNGNLAVSIGYQVTDSPTSPPAASSATAIGSGVSSDGVSEQSSFSSIATDADANQYIRFGWIGKLSSGSTLATGKVSGSLDIVSA